MLDRNESPHSLLCIGPNTRLEVTDRREALDMYESFEQFTSSPADQKTERVQCVLESVSRPSGYRIILQPGCRQDVRVLCFGFSRGNKCSEERERFQDKGEP